MTEEKEIKYNFSNHAEILEAIDLFYEKSKPTDMRVALNLAVQEFLLTRTNSQLIDLADLEPSIWDYDDMFLDYWYKEIDRRNYPNSQEMKDLLNDWHKEWAGKDSKLTKFNNLIEQVDGIQKKTDKIVQLLEGFSITMTVKEALKL